MARTKRGTKGGVTTVDFSGVESGGRTRVPEDDYKVRVKSVKHETSSKGNPMLVWEFEIIEGKFKGKVLRDNTTLMDKTLWKLKQLLEAMGVTVPNKKVALRLAKYIGNELAITTVDDEYEGRISSKIADYVDPNVLDEDEDEEDEDEEEDELEDLSRAELKEYISENELDVRVKKSMSDDEVREAIREAEGDEEDEDEDEEEDEEPPARKKSSKSKATAKKGKKSKKSKDDDEEIEDLDLDEI